MCIDNKSTGLILKYARGYSFVSMHIFLIAFSLIYVYEIIDQRWKRTIAVEVSVKLVEWSTQAVSWVDVWWLPTETSQKRERLKTSACSRTKIRKARNGPTPAASSYGMLGNGAVGLSVKVDRRRDKKLQVRWEIYEIYCCCFHRLCRTKNPPVTRSAAQNLALRSGYY